MKIFHPTQTVLLLQVSMAKERKRLINEDLVQDVPSASHPQARDNPAQDRQERQERLTIRGNQIVVEGGGSGSRPDLLN